VSLPFTSAQFFDNFAAYNAAWWPVIALFWAATLRGVVQLMRGRAANAGLVALLAAHWAWSGVVYHGLFFSRINPAARGFAAAFVLQAAVLIWFGFVRRRLLFEWGRTPRHIVAGAFLAASLLYPVLAGLTGHLWPRGPAFAVPCPTTLFTTGLLLTLKPPVPWPAFLIPIAWSLVGGSAAVTFGVWPDLLLFAGSAALIGYAIAGRRGRT
jgi:hypothetical protein